MPDWKKNADDATRWCLTKLWIPGAKRFHTAIPVDPKDLPFETMWGNGIAFSMLVGATRANPKYYRPYMEAFFKGMDGHWDKDAPVPGYDAYLSASGDDKYYDDNEWMVLTFVEAYGLTHDKKYLDRAIEAMKFVLSGWSSSLGGGIFWKADHKSKNTCSNGPAATAALQLARYTKRKEYVDWAQRIVHWTDKTLQDRDGLYFDNISAENGRIERTKWTYNTALMLRAHLGLWRMTHDRKHLDEAIRIAKASEKEFVLPQTGAFRDSANFSHLLCEAYLDLWRETKMEWLRDRAESNGRYVVSILKDSSDGGYRSDWRSTSRRTEPRKTLMSSASVGRLFWLLREARSKS